MSTFEIKPIYTLRINLSGEYYLLVKITVFDSFNRIVEHTSSSPYDIHYSLAQGLYTLRVEVNGEIKDEVILLDKNIDYLIAEDQYPALPVKNFISLPKQYSSALLGEGRTYGSSHEYYTYPAIEFSKTDTFQLASPATNDSSLFIFLRFPSIEKFDKSKVICQNPFSGILKLLMKMVIV